MQNPTSPPQFKRRNKLPKPRFQLSLAGTFLALVALSLFVQTLVCGAQFAKFASQFQGNESDMLAALPGLLGRSLLYGSLMIVPALGIIAIHITFRMAGPIYRFEAHLRSVIAGESPEACQIRAGDHHHELCELINGALEVTARQAASDSEETAESEVAPTQAA